MEVYTEKKNCRNCSSSALEDVLSLGNQCISAFVDTETEPIIAPLDLIICKDCHLLQMRHTTNPDVLYTDNYGYRSGLNATMTKEMQNIAASISALKRLEKGEVVVDIGSSDATLLKFYARDLIKVGFEPVKKFRAFHNRKDIFCVPDFFSAKAYRRLFGDQQAKVITAIAMFYDLDNPHAFLEDITNILDDDGILVIQQNYLPKMLSEGTFDNISHEHVAYYSLTTLQKLLDRHDLEVFEVDESPINGGCFRTYISFKGSRPPSLAVQEMLQKESDLRLDTLEPYRDFEKKVISNVQQLKDFVSSERARDKKIWIYGASTRGNVILQAAGLKYPEIEGASERNPEKWNKHTLGTNIPMFSEEEARIANPDYFLVLPYWFGPEFLEREKKYLESGGAFLFPLPEFRVVTK